MTTVRSEEKPPIRPISDRARWTMAIGGGLICLVMFILGFIKPNQEQPQVTRGDYNAALQMWKASGVRSYDMRLTLSGRGDQDSEVILEVRNGRVVKSLYNGKPEDDKFKDQWTVDNQFRYINDDLTKAAGPGFGVQNGVTITLHAEFDPKYGYPDHYFRQAHGPSPLQSQWKVNEFKVVKD